MGSERRPTIPIAVGFRAILPRLFAELKESYDFQLVFCAIMLPCYLFIWFYAQRGWRIGR
jgi:fucose permease